MRFPLVSRWQPRSWLAQNQDNPIARSIRDSRADASMNNSLDEENPKVCCRIYRAAKESDAIDLGYTRLGTREPRGPSLIETLPPLQGRADRARQTMFRASAAQPARSAGRFAPKRRPAAPRCARDRNRGSE